MYEGGARSAALTLHETTAPRYYIKDLKKIKYDE